MTDFTDNFHLINHLLLISKFYVYRARDKKQVNIFQLKSVINKIKNVELKISQNEQKNVKNLARNGNLFCKDCKINGAWLGAKMNGKMGGWAGGLRYCCMLVLFLLFCFFFFFFYLSFAVTLLLLFCFIFIMYRF